MKKVLLFGVAVAFAAVSFSSCKKCITCTYEYLGVSYSSGEVCGKKSEIEDIEDTWKAYEETYEGVSVTCE